MTRTRRKRNSPPPGTTGPRKLTGDGRPGGDRDPGRLWPAGRFGRTLPFNDQIAIGDMMRWVLVCCAVLSLALPARARSSPTPFR